jgi:hypothetical protein
MQNRGLVTDSSGNISTTAGVLLGLGIACLGAYLIVDPGGLIDRWQVFVRRKGGTLTRVLNPFSPRVPRLIVGVGWTFIGIFVAITVLTR